ncbi:helix-turn-helix domain-containing protein [Stenotrophomonas lactitubi]|uniref:helix-turn-helix domain-containing protein n=1 Tax=Stenotrophomonas lactitubi TaxID=2045214 RepID=UPI00320B635A
MSVQAMTWALDQQVATESISRHVLLCLANYADKDGRNAFPSAATLAQDTGLAVRTVRARLAQLLETGVIRKGNQAIVAAYIPAADRRPVCYDLVMERGACGAPREGERGARHDTNGVHATTARGARGAANPSYNHQEETHRSPAGDEGAANAVDEQADLLGGKAPVGCPHEAIIAAYHKELPNCPEVQGWSDRRRAHLRARWKTDADRQSVEWWRGLFAYMRDSDYLMGKVNSFQVSLSWLIKSEENLLKVCEGNYHNNRNGGQG